MADKFVNYSYEDAKNNESKSKMKCIYYQSSFMISVNTNIGHNKFTDMTPDDRKKLYDQMEKASNIYLNNIDKFIFIDNMKNNTGLCNNDYKVLNRESHCEIGKNGTPHIHMYVSFNFYCKIHKPSSADFFQTALKDYCKNIHFDCKYVKDNKGHVLQYIRKDCDKPEHDL